MKDNNAKKIVLLDNTLLDTNKIITISENSNIPYELASINQLVLNLNSYINDILLIPDTMIEIITDYFKKTPILQKQNAILLSSSHNYQPQIKNDFSWLNILDEIDINSNSDEIMMRIQNCIQAKIKK